MREYTKSKIHSQMVKLRASHSILKALMLQKPIPMNHTKTKTSLRLITKFNLDIDYSKKTSTDNFSSKRRKKHY